MTTAYFFDILEEWDKINHLILNESFIHHVNIYKWWNNNAEDGLDTIVCKNQHNTEDEKYIIEKANEFGRDSPYWLCSPHQCVDINVLVMGSLASLILKSIDLNIPLYYLKISPFSIVDNNPHIQQLYDYDYHVVVSNKYIEPNTVFDFKYNHILAMSLKDVKENKEIILFDIIYPLMSFFGNQWSLNRRHLPLEKVKVTHCELLNTNMTSMKYKINYDKK
jgi:hypothetical protein